jgi:chromosome segregation ATPase
MNSDGHGWEQAMQNSRNMSADWNQVLDQVEHALENAVQRLQEREQALAQSASAAATLQSLDFAQFEDRLAAFAGQPREVEQQLAELDASLGEGEEKLRRWLAQSDATRRRLAAWVGRAVG